MAKPKTLIIYAASASIMAITAAIAPARERGQAVRLISLEEFRGETESNAGAVFVERAEGDELVYDRIQQAYPMIEVQDWTGKVDVESPKTFVAPSADEVLKALRLRLIGLGGSAPAGATAEELGDLIAARLAESRHIPILPNAATQGTVIPDATPIAQQAPGDQLIDENATGTGPAVLQAMEQVAGEGVTGTSTATASGTASTATDAAAGTGGASGDGGASTGPTDEEVAALVKGKSEVQLRKLATDEEVPEGTIKSDSDKGDIARAILVQRAKKASS